MFNMKKTVCLLAAAVFLLTSCLDDLLFGSGKLVILFTGDTVGEIEPCG